MSTITNQPPGKGPQQQDLCSSIEGSDGSGVSIIARGLLTPGPGALCGGLIGATTGGLRSPSDHTLCGTLCRGLSGATDGGTGLKTNGLGIILANQIGILCDKACIENPATQSPLPGQQFQLQP